MQFDKGFFEKETICDFEVPSMMKRVWAAEIEVLEVLKDICERNGIQYYASFGTLLGAVRHKGFIPWDYDIDIDVKREDFERLVRILPEQLPKGFGVYGIHAPKRKNVDELDHTYQIFLGAERDQWDINEYIRYFHGFPFDMIGIDIFPLDYVPRDQEFWEVQSYLVDFILTIFAHREEFIRDGKYRFMLEQFENASGIHIPEDDSIFHLWKAMDAVASLCRREEEADELLIYPLRYFNVGKIKKEWYEDAIRMPFENTEICVPAAYDEVLKAEFGNYMEFVKNTENYPFYRKMEKALSEQLTAMGLPGNVDEFVERVLSGEITVNVK